MVQDWLAHRICSRRSKEHARSRTRSYSWNSCLWNARRNGHDARRRQSGGEDTGRYSPHLVTAGVGPLNQELERRHTAGRDLRHADVVVVANAERARVVAVGLVSAHCRGWGQDGASEGVHSSESWIATSLWAGVRPCTSRTVIDCVVGEEAAAWTGRAQTRGQVVTVVRRASYRFVPVSSVVVPEWTRGRLKV